MKNKTYIFYSDPGHGWMKVPRSDLKALGIEDKISSYSYQRGDSVFLEEDMDVTTFATAFKEKFGHDLKTRGTNSGRQSRIRSYQAYSRSRLCHHGYVYETCKECAWETLRVGWWSRRAKRYKGAKVMEKHLALGTCHVDPSARTRSGGIEVGGGLRTTEHEYGWIVHLQNEVPPGTLRIWFRPIYALAIKEGATMVLFDRDIEAEPDFHTFDW